MVPVDIDPTLTVRSFLFGADGCGMPELAEELDRRGVLDAATGVMDRMAQSGGSAVRTEVARAVQGLLDVDLGDVVVAAWRKWRRLAAAGRRTRDDPGATEVVSLAEHTVRWISEPSVDILVGQVRVASLHVEVKVEITLRGVAATVRGGKLVALTGGSCAASASLSVEGQQLAERSGDIQLALVLRLHDGVPLVIEPATTPEAAGATRSDARDRGPDGRRPPLVVHLPRRVDQYRR